MIAHTVKIEFGDWLFHAWIHDGTCYAKHEDTGTTTRKHRAVVVERTGCRQWAGPAGQVVNPALIDALEQGYRELVG